MMHQVEYIIPLSGSKLFDMVMFQTADKLCQEFPGLKQEVPGGKIRITGELDDEAYESYRKKMFGD